MEEALVLWLELEYKCQYWDHNNRPEEVTRTPKGDTSTLLVIKSDTLVGTIQVLSLLEQGSSMETVLGFKKENHLGFVLGLLGLLQGATTMS